MIFLDNTVVNTALPSIARDLDASTSTLQWVVDSYTLILSGLLLLGGTLGDRFGRRRFLTLGMLVFGAGALGASLATDAGTLILMRGVQGAGGALVLPATLSIITDVFPRAERAKAIGIWTAVCAVGIATAPVFGGYLVDRFDWSAVFLMHLPIVGLALVGMRIVPESRDKRLFRLDVPGAVLATLGLLAVVYGIIQGSVAGWTSAEIVTAFVAGIGLLGAFLVVERRSAAPMLPLHFFKQKDFTGAVLIIGLVFFALGVTFFFMSQYFQLVQGKSALTAGLYSLPAAGMMVVGAAISGMLNKSVGPKVLTLLASGAAAFGLAWLTQIDMDSSYLTVAIGFVAFGVGGGLGLAPLTDIVMAAVPVNDAGIGSSVNDVSRELGATLGVAVTGTLVSSLYSSQIEEGLTGVVASNLVQQAGDGIGVAAGIAQSLPAEVATAVIQTANEAFVDAINNGLWVSVGFMVAAGVVSLLLIPWKMRERQAESVVVAAGAAPGVSIGAVAVEERIAAFGLDPDAA